MGTNLTIISIFNGIGDVFLALPLIRFLSEQPNNTVILFTNAESKIFFSEMPHVIEVGDTTLQFDPKDLGELSQSFKGHYITLISLSFYVPLTNYEDTLIKVIQPNKLIGYKDYNLLMHDKILSKLPMFIKYFKVCNLNYTNQNRMLPDKLVKMIPFNKDDSKVKICLHIDTDKSKEWSYENWLDIISELTTHSAFEIVLLGQPKLKKKINTLVVHPASFISNLYHLIQCDFFFGIDSCFAHIADAHLKRGLVLYGPVNFNEWKPFSKNLKAIKAKAGNMENVEYNMVLDRIKKILVL